MNIPVYKQDLTFLKNNMKLAFVCQEKSNRKIEHNFDVKRLVISLIESIGSPVF
jgi:hypothetical protein